MLTNQSIGYIDAPIPKGLDLKEEINRITDGEQCDVIFDNIGIKNSIDDGQLNGGILSFSICR